MDLGFFDEHGYQVVRDLFAPAEIEPIVAFLDTERELSLEVVQEVLAFDDTAGLIAEIQALLRDRPRFEALPVQTRMILSGHFRLEARLAETLRAVPRSDKLQAVLRRIFPDRDLRMHLPPVARFVLPGNDFAGVPPHQDASYNEHVKELVTVWVPFTEIDDACGGVAVYHGSGSTPEIATEGDGNFWLKPIDTEGYEKTHVKIGPGDALLLNPYVIHESMPNRSNRIRQSVDYRFFAAPVTSTKHYLELSTWQVVAPNAAQPMKGA
jgi:hypothetical protein